jgi:hypothetical protein
MSVLSFDGSVTEVPPVSLRALVGRSDGLFDELTALTVSTPDAESSGAVRAHLLALVEDARVHWPGDHVLARVERWVSEPDSLTVRDARLHARIVRETIACACDEQPVLTSMPASRDEFELWLAAAAG